MSIVHAHIVNNTVVNLILCDSDWKVDEGFITPSIDNVAIGWQHDGKNFIAPSQPVLTKNELAIQIESEKASRIAEAKDAISIWQTKLHLGRKLTEVETASLGLWIDYIDAVAAIKVSSKKTISWPEKPKKF